MKKYRKKPVVVEAVQWFKAGDHPSVLPIISTGRYARCPRCQGTVHGEVLTPSGAVRICPGDWIITGVKGEHYPCKLDIFEMTYEEEE